MPKSVTIRESSAVRESVVEVEVQAWRGGKARFEVRSEAGRHAAEISRIAVSLGCGPHASEIGWIARRTVAQVVAAFRAADFAVAEIPGADVATGG